MGSNLFFASTGAVLDVVGVSIDDGLINGWRDRVHRTSTRLGWITDVKPVVRRHASGALLAIPAPIDQLLLATEVNEWALCAALIEHDPVRWGALEQALVAEALEANEGSSNPAASDPPVIEEAVALARFERLALLESHPKLRALIDAATIRGLPHMLDESELTLGAGVGGHDFPLSDLPDVRYVEWQELRDIPTAIVTGSNGKTTTVRLLAACARGHGWHTAYNCTDGVFLDGDLLAQGDYSGPAGARLAMRDHRAEAAILETARGGILRRGIAVSQATVAVVTNVSSDHFGEYGIDDLAGLAEVKLSVAAAVGPRGLLILNAEDSSLRAQVDGLVRRSGRSPPLGWFSAVPDSQALRDYRAGGAPTCGVHAGRLCLNHGGTEHDLGVIAGLPLSMGGVAAYNVANMAGAALGAVALGISAPTIAAVLARFGSKLTDNPGRMMRFDVQGVKVLVDYAHNPDGLRGFLEVATHLRGTAGRLGLLLGQAGNRQDADIEALVRVAAEFRPEFVVVKENEAQLRGRALGEISRIIRAELKRLNFSESALAEASDEAGAARRALDWALPGDVLALPLHSASGRSTVIAMLKERSGAD